MCLVRNSIQEKIIVPTIPQEKIIVPTIPQEKMIVPTIAQEKIIVPTIPQICEQLIVHRTLPKYTPE